MASSRPAPPLSAAASSQAPTAPFDLEREGLEGAFLRFSPYVAAIGLNVLGRDEELDDLVQEVFLRAHKHLHQLRQPEAIKPWLAQITVNTARRMLYRRRLVRFVGLEDPERDPYRTLSAPGLNPEQLTELRQLYALLDRAPVQDRLAWTLRHVQGERLQEVALLCGCSLATAKRRIASVEAMLHAELQRHA